MAEVQRPTEKSQKIRETQTGASTDRTTEAGSRRAVERGDLENTAIAKASNNNLIRCINKCLNKKLKVFVRVRRSCGVVDV